MCPGLIPKAFRITVETEVKPAHQVEVPADQFCPLRECGPSGDSCPHTLAPGPHMLPGRHSVPWAIGPGFRDLTGSKRMKAASLPCPSHVCKDPHLGSILRELSLAQGAGLRHCSHEDSISMCVGPGTFPRAFKCIILLEAHLRQGLAADWKTTHLLTPEWGGS